LARQGTNRATVIELVSCYQSFANVPLIGAADDLAVAATAIGTAIASAIARLRT